jgi:hypothetical protein
MGKSLLPGVAPLFLCDGVLGQRVQFLAGLEAHCFAGCNAHFGARAGIAANAGLAGTNAKDTKPAQLNALACCESLFEALKHRIDRCFGLCAGQACALDHMVNNVLFNQSGYLAGVTGFDCTTSYRVDVTGFAPILEQPNEPSANLK